MRKILICCCLLSLFLTGCGKKYKSMDEYVEQMKKNRAKQEILYVEANRADIEGNKYSRTMFEGNKYRTDYSNDEGATYESSLLYDGKDLYEYVEGAETTDVVYDVEAKDALNQNPFHPIQNWWEDIESGKVKAKFLKNNYFRCAFDCTLIDYSDGREACIYEKHGIAVYYKQEPLSQGYKRKGVIIDVLRIDDETGVPPNLFELNEQIKRVKKDK